MRRYSLRRSGMIVVGCVCLLVCLSGYSMAQEPEGVHEDKLIAANTKFGFKIFAELLKEGVDQNIFISPSSIAFALAMVYNGAAGETKEAMARALEVGEMPLEEVNHANSILKEILEKADPEVQLDIANSLWGREGISFKPDFIRRNKEFYGAEVAALDFGSPEAVSIINDWVQDNTNGKIDKIVDNINPLTILFLINAIYFKGKWSEEFDPEETEEDIFYLLEGSRKKVPMMYQSDDYRYYRGERFQAVSLPYGEKRISMYIFLPDRDYSLEEFYEQLNAENWKSWMSQFSFKEGEICLPRFKLEYEVTLNDALKALGMGVAFDPIAANFEGMCEILQGINFYISKVKHKTFVEVNEEGTEAAAATSVEMVMLAVRPEQPFSMVVDRPFFFAIRDNKTGTLLFMGSIVDPQ